MVIHISIYHNIVIFKKKNSISSWSSFWNILNFCHKTTNFHKLQIISVSWNFSMKFCTYNYSKFKHNKPFRKTFDTIYLHFLDNVTLTHLTFKNTFTWYNVFLQTFFWESYFESNYNWANYWFYLSTKLK